MHSAPEGFYFQASNGSVALPVAGYIYNSDWTPLLAELSPAGMAASLAAPDPVRANVLVLRILKHTDIVTSDKRLAAYIDRCTARPAFKRALDAQVGDFRQAA